LLAVTLALTMANFSPAFLASAYVLRT